MLQAIVLGFLAGVFAGNGVPHFVKGIVKESYPCALGNGPVPNLLGGWACFVIAGVCIFFAFPTATPGILWIAGAVGVLAIGLFHAAIGAFGRST
jgi:hypothetical protein